MSSEHPRGERASRLKGRWLRSADLEEIDDDSMYGPELLHRSRHHDPDDSRQRQAGHRRKPRRDRYEPDTLD